MRPGGKLLIADFAPVQGNVVLRVLHRAYYGTGNFIYWMKGLAAHCTGSTFTRSPIRGSV